MVLYGPTEGTRTEEEDAGGDEEWSRKVRQDIDLSLFTVEDPTQTDQQTLDLSACSDRNTSDSSLPTM